MALTGTPPRHVNVPNTASLARALGSAEAARIRVEAAGIARQSQLTGGSSKAGLCASVLAGAALLFGAGLAIGSSRD